MHPLTYNSMMHLSNASLSFSSHGQTTYINVPSILFITYVGTCRISDTILTSRPSPSSTRIVNSALVAYERPTWVSFSPPLSGCHDHCHHHLFWYVSLMMSYVFFIQTTITIPNHKTNNAVILNLLTILCWYLTCHKGQVKGRDDSGLKYKQTYAEHLLVKAKGDTGFRCFWTTMILLDLAASNTLKIGSFYG